MDEMDLNPVRAGLPAAPDQKKARRDFSRLGFALLTFFVAAAVLQGLAGYLLSLPGVPRSPLVSWGLGYIVPLYVIGVPLTLLVMRGVPAERVEPQRLGFGKLIAFLLMCFPIMYAGNLVGTLMSYMFSGGSAENPLESLVMDSSWIQVVVLAVLAPLFEEFIFRKQLIDRIGRYGEKTAIFFSALTFGLFHGNLYQFFYAFALGLLFAWIYTRTRKLRYSFFLHMCVNFWGSVVAPWILTNTDLGVVDEVLAGNMDVDISGLLPLYAYSFALLALVIAGLVLLIRRRRDFLLLPTAEQLPRGSGFRISCLNPGVILFAIACMGIFVYSLLI